MYLYELPTTGAISFSDFCIDRSTDKSYTFHIPDITQARANIRGLLKESKRTEHTERDFLRLIKAIEGYLPLLQAIQNCIAHDEIGLVSEPTFSWRSTLSSNLFNTSPRILLQGLHTDLAFSLLTYAFALSNLAHSVVVSLGAYEHERAISDSERKNKDEKLNIAVDFLLKASGVFSYISDVVIPEWEVNKYDVPSGSTRPPELTREVASALSKLSMADAQALAIRKLLSKSAYESNITPGPPLPKSHPKPPLVLKLHLECANLYSSARTLAKTLGAVKDSNLDAGGVSAQLRKYLADESAFHTAIAHKWLGVEAGEAGGTRGGDAVAYMAWAKKELEEMKDGGKGIAIGKEEKEEKERRKRRIFDELDSVNLFYKHYRKMNDSLHFQPVPPFADLQSRIPAGRLAIAAKQFVPPSPSFGPGSVQYLRKQAEGLELTGSAQESPVSEASNGSSHGDYAGAGAYF